MVTGLAYLGLTVVILAGLAFIWSSARGRELAAMDRRISSMRSAGAAEVSTNRSRPITAISVPDRFVPMLAQAQVELTAKALRNIGIGSALVGGFLLLLVGPAATLIFLIGAPMLALGWLKGRARKRVDALAEAMPLYLDTVRQLQGVGNSLAQALERALADAPDSLSSYFEVSARRLAMGAPVGETMQQLADRLQIAEVSMLAAAIRTNLRYGGSISGVFSNLAHILRERTRLRRELVAATSEAKVSSRVLIAMPLLAMTFLVMMNPGYIDFFLEDERGKTLATAAIALEFTGILIIRRMLRLEF